MRDDDSVTYDPDARLLTAWFVYRPLVGGEVTTTHAANQQEALLDTAMRRILDVAPPPLRHALAEGDPPRVLQHLRRFARRRTADFFVHKDLGRFLRGELDTYIKQHLVQLDDLQAADGAALERAFNRYRTVREIATLIIDFLAQIEDFQRRLFEKPKFIARTGYLITLDHVPADLLGTVLGNQQQLNEWRRLYGDAVVDALPDQTAKTPSSPRIEEGVSESIQNPQSKIQNPMLDTRFFDQATVDQILAAIPDLDAATTGVLYRSENWQALRLLREQLRGSIKCIYIDPPYNTGNDGFLYKDRYQHSSWLAMMYDRLVLARDLLADDGVIFVSIDDNEQARLKLLMDAVFGAENYRNTILLRRYDKNINLQFMEKGLSTLNVGAEQVLVYAVGEDADLNPVYREVSEQRQNTGYWKGFWNAADRRTMRYELLGVTPTSGQWKWQEKVASTAASASSS